MVMNGAKGSGEACVRPREWYVQAAVGDGNGQGGGTKR